MNEIKVTVDVECDGCSAKGVAVEIGDWMVLPPGWYVMPDAPEEEDEAAGMYCACSDACVRKLIAEDDEMSEEELDS